MTDVAVVGAGPNGLAAAVTLARAGLRVRVYERAATAGGGSRTAELTLPGFRHDVCSAVHPMAVASPFFRAFGLTGRVPFVTPEVSFAHPLPDGRSGIAYRDLERTADGLGRDARLYRALVRPLASHAAEVAEVTLAPLLAVPRHPVLLARFGIRSFVEGRGARFRDEVAPALLTGAAAHAIVRQPSLAGAGAGLMLTAHAHAGGWPVPVGGSQAIVDALVADLVAHGGEVVTGHEVTSLDELDATAIVLDVTPRAFVRLAGARMPARARRRYERFRYGPGIAKLDLALSAPVPWRDPELARAGTVHLGGTRAQIARAEDAVLRGRHAERPFTIVAQPSLFDASRAPGDAHTLWAYAHMPSGSDRDPTETILTALEEHAPGIRDVVIAHHARSAAQVATENPNYVGGDIAAGAATLGQLFARPVASPAPWRTPLPGVYLCGASTAPGPGVHGQSGWLAARCALRDVFGIRTAPELGT
ncbi:phytoene desaturase family protein [Microbacterium sp. No. 7]|uniref:phytoene desaturase family protein n=1 Tax=Microbacterium sp. No. 7 TaxID=1714373 RepID=UPI0006D0095C|nr:NAD(P)/FAD-dependent oxidoreductase [Microbacterium sp. No. 7]ALJ18507.1 dehydrogenase [Microbacterium sp. No. 7]